MAIIPNISCDIAGPLGAIHLPRLWSKLRLSAAGQLEDGYPECGAGFDQMVLDGLGVDHGHHHHGHHHGNHSHGHSRRTGDRATGCV